MRRSSPHSWRRRTSSAPPRWRPPTKTWGSVTRRRWGRSAASSGRKPGSMERSRSSTAARSPRRMARTARQSS
uniref:Uncharacterized protein n=1 Tax=Arundo donax TaxID=35708 RepID=A0A0A9GHM7_ARUDO